jgi:hypothetical protein
MAIATAAENAAIVGSYDFKQFNRIVDVGGGLGGFLTEVLKAPLHSRAFYTISHKW